jgi:glycosyltransferase involved in cell wall biosynthesis
MALRVAVSTNAPWVGSGYGAQMAELGPRMKADGHEVSILANYGLSGTVLDWNGISVYPQGIDAYSNDLHPAQMARIQSETKDRQFLGMTLFDVWPLKNPEWDNVPLLSWTPIDHSPVTPEVLQFFRRGGRKWAVAMSRFGETELRNAGLSRDQVFYAPHSFNPEVWRPDGETMRKTMNIPEDAHLSWINAANKGSTPPRKNWSGQLLAWSIFASLHPDAYLYLHTDISGIAQGVQLEPLMNALKIPRDRIRIVPQYEYRMGIDQATVAKITRSADVLLHATYGEGFGVSQIESLASGVPVISTRWTAMTELVGAGWLVEGQIEWDPFQGSWWKIPNVDAIVAALEASYALKGDAEGSAALKEKALTFADQYATPRVYAEHWRPIFERMEVELKKPVPTGGVNREARRAALRKGKK